MMNLAIEPAATARGALPVQAEAAAATPATGLSPAALAGLFEAISGMRNARALTAMLGGCVAGVLLDRFLSTLGGHSGPVLGLLGSLAFFVAGATGVNAAGVILMAQARHLPPRGLQAAILFGLKCVPRLVVLWGALLLVGLVVIAATALACLVCKIPFIGPPLFVVVFPVTVVVSGLTLCGLAICMVLALPAVWEGATLAAALAGVLAIARSRLVESLLLLAVASLLTLAVGGVVVGVVWTGLMPMVAVSSRVISDWKVPGFADILRAFSSGVLGGRDAFDGDSTAALLGSGLLWSFAGSLISMVWLLGLNLVYLQLVEGFVRDSSAATPGRRADESRRIAAPKTRDASSRPFAAVPAAVLATRPRQAAGRRWGIALPLDEDGTVPFAASTRCPHCFTATQADDVFCAICGYKLG